MRSVKLPRLFAGALVGACALAMTAGPGLTQLAIEAMPAFPAAPPSYVNAPLVLGPSAGGPPIFDVPPGVSAEPGAIIGTQTIAAAPEDAVAIPILESRLFAARALTLCDDAMLNPHAYSTQTTIECATGGGMDGSDSE